MALDLRIWSATLRESDMLNKEQLHIARQTARLCQCEVRLRPLTVVYDTSYHLHNPTCMMYVALPKVLADYLIGKE